MRSLRVKVTLFSSLLLISLITIMFFGAFNVYRSSLENTIMESMHSSADDSAWYLKNFIDGYLAPLEKLADHTLVKTMNMEAQLDVISKQINPNYENVAVIDLLGIAHYIDGDKIDLSDRPYIKKALTGNRSISEVIISRKTGENVIVAAVPIIDADRVVGALIARLDMSLLQQYISTRSLNTTNDTFIISNEGSVVMASGNHKEINEKNLFSLATEDLDYENFSAFIKAREAFESGSGEFELEGTHYYVCYKSIVGTKWKIYIAIKKQLIVNKLRDVLIILTSVGVIISIMALTLTWSMIKKYTSPILELNQLVEKGSEGDFNVHFIPTTKDEIAHLGLSFNKLMETIKTLTYFDPVTHALNRNVLKAEMNASINNESIESFSLIMFQVEGLQLLKEVHGFECEDTILKEFNSRILTTLTDGDRVYRFDEDTLVVKLSWEHDSDENMIQSYKRAKQILDLLEESYRVNTKTLNLLFNVGIYTRSLENSHEDPILSVLAATNYAKQLDGERIVRFDNKLHQTMDEQKNLINELYRAVRSDEFVLMYQPLYKLKDKKVAKMEALIRWNHPQKGLMYPGDFIEIAEMYDVILQIDFWVMEEACRILTKWEKQAIMAKPISVNVTSKTFESKHFLKKVDELLSRYEIKPGLLEFEITERVVIRNMEENISILQQLKLRGIKVSIDDFGIGYSSLSYLVKLPIDSVKIDRSFIEQMNHSKSAKVIVSTIISLCKALELQVIAEGIELESELKYLEDNQCDIGQGYYFSKPVTLEEIEGKLS
ncbi:EAL domain-containing protein [Fusibacter bizertensis]|uniref:EAL domain-containing protein n=1 Tax=Fusibacter bizertensis TaxID=1488331 RepID=A0ABT6NFT6_9FIRM|nr:EAL domain-containing protein [Fusibacter bizertensis]MDH8679296.1 EAL domain-containing protein [Fusibacter bizertensis]